MLILSVFSNRWGKIQSLGKHPKKLGYYICCLILSLLMNKLKVGDFPSILWHSFRERMMARGFLQLYCQFWCNWLCTCPDCRSPWISFWVSHKGNFLCIAVAFVCQWQGSPGVPILPSCWCHLSLICFYASPP